MLPPTCASSTKTCPRRTATIPGAGELRGNLSQLVASQSERIGDPNTRTAAPQPQKARDGQPAGWGNISARDSARDDNAISAATANRTVRIFNGDAFVVEELVLLDVREEPESAGNHRAADGPKRLAQHAGPDGALLGLLHGLDGRLHHGNIAYRISKQ